MTQLTEKRILKLKEVSSYRQTDLTVILENVHDPHNIGAVLRSCDSVGIDEIFILYTEDRLKKRGLQKSDSSSTGINQWIQIHYYTDLDSCIADVRSKYKKILGTNLKEDSNSLYDLDLTDSVALAYGNEKDGLSEEFIAIIDGNFIIPQVGFAQSLNISVACAVSLYETFRQRNNKGKYQSKDQSAIYNRFVELHKAKRTKKSKKGRSF